METRLLAFIPTVSITVALILILTKRVLGNRMSALLAHQVGVG